jgi:hypothetical protein
LKSKLNLFIAFSNSPLSIFQKKHFPLHSAPKKEIFSTDGWIFTPLDSDVDPVVYKWKNSNSISANALYQNNHFVINALMPYSDILSTRKMPRPGIYQVEFRPNDKLIVTPRHDRVVPDSPENLRIISELLNNPILPEDLWWTYVEPNESGFNLLSASVRSHLYQKYAWKQTVLKELQDFNFSLDFGLMCGVWPRFDELAAC